MSVFARFTYTVQRHLEGSILLKLAIWHVTFFFTCRAQEYTFCLLIVRYMLSDKIKGKSPLKAQTFLHERDVHVCFLFRLSMHLSTENSAGSNIFKTLHGEMFTYEYFGILQQWSLTWSQTLNRHASGKD